MTAPITGISSMATRLVLAECLDAWQAGGGTPVRMESVGGVDAAKRVQAGEAFDLVVLASDAVDRLIASGHVVAGSRVDLLRSPVAIAVRAGTAAPDIGSEDALRQAVLAAPSLSYSTGPSGAHLVRLFERWGLTDTLRERIVQAPPGVPVGTLVARGEVALGFQQLSELMHLDGIDVVGTLPEAVQFITTFSAGLCGTSARAADVQRLTGFLTGPDAAATARRHGMAPASAA